MQRSLFPLVFLVLFSGLIVSQSRLAPDSHVVTAFVNGQWFTGTDFQRTTFYVADGRLTTRKPAGPVETVDLQGGFVVPPFADAHIHSPSSKHDLAESNRAFLDAGVFYVLNAGGNARPANVIRDQLGTPEAVDVIFAHALFTCPGGHPRALSRVSGGSRRPAV